MGYAATMALIGYLSPPYLLVGIAHLGLVAYEFVAASYPGADAPRLAGTHPVNLRMVSRCLWWLAGLAATVLLLWPELPYFRALSNSPPPIETI